MKQPPAPSASQPAIRIALADDFPAMLGGWHREFEAIPGCQVVFQARNGKTFIEGLAAALPIRIALVDLSMPVMDGLEVIRRAKANHPEVLMLATSFDDSDASIMRAMQAGADGFLSKTAEPEEYAMAVEQLLQTGHYYSKRLCELLVRRTDGLTDQERARSSAHASITLREWEVMEAIAGIDEPNSIGVADMLGMKPRTVDSHCKNVCDKLGLKTRLGAVAYLLRERLLK